MILGKEKNFFKFRGIREDLFGIGNFIILNKLYVVFLCMWCLRKRLRLDNEGGSLNFDLRIREKGGLGKRILFKGRFDKVCFVFLKILKSIIGLKNNLFLRYFWNMCINVGINKVYF